jgi:hypothetical protein
MKSNPGPKMKLEIETKFDVPLETSQEEVAEEIKGLLLAEGWEIISERSDKKNLLYYDTPEMSFHKEGETLRRVSPFDPKKFPGCARYDFKQGRGQLRLEGKAWSKIPLDEEEIIYVMGLGKKVEKIRPIAEVHISPWFLDLEKGKDSAELKVDTCSYRGKDLFRELELELKSGDAGELFRTSELLSKRLKLKYLTQQKYSRVVDALGGYDAFRE